LRYAPTRHVLTIAPTVAVLRAILLLAAFAMFSGNARAEPDGGCRAITRTNLVSCAVGASIVLQREREAIRATNGRIEAARPFLPSNPQISAGIARSDSPIGATGATTWSLGVSQAFQIAGQSALRTEVAERELAAQQWRTIASARETAMQAWIAYFAVLFAEEEVRLAAQVQRAGERLSASTRARAESGLVSMLDADVADALQVKYTQIRIQADANLHNARSTLESQLGFDPKPGAASVSVVGELLPVPNVAIQALALLNAARPDVKALAEDSKAFDAQSRFLRRSRIPNLTLALTAQRDSQFGQMSYGVGLSMPIPIPQPIGRTNRGETLEFEALAARSRFDMARLQREVRLAIVTSLNMYDARLMELGTYRQNRIQRAQTSLIELAKEVELGRIAIQNALVSVQALTEFLRGELLARHALCLASVDLARAAGLALEAP
jgi:outer membrane protein, heavy metal efflux system